MRERNNDVFVYFFQMRPYLDVFYKSVQIWILQGDLLSFKKRDTIMVMWYRLCP